MLGGDSGTLSPESTLLPTSNTPVGTQLPSTPSPTTAPASGDLPPSYHGATQSPPNILFQSSSSYFVTVNTTIALWGASAIRSNADAGCPVVTINESRADDKLSIYYTCFAAYELCRWATFFVQRNLSPERQEPERFQSALQSISSAPGNITTAYRSAQCTLPYLIMNVTLINRVPTTGGTPPTFALFLIFAGNYKSTMASTISYILSKSYPSPFSPLDFKEQLGFQHVYFDSASGPAPTDAGVVAYSVLKDSTSQSAGGASGVAIWTFLLIQVIAVLASIVIGTTVVQWVMKPPPLPSLKERIVKGWN